MNHQETFSKVAVHLLTQKRKAQVLEPRFGDFKCAYKDDAGRKCAVGCLLPNGHEAEDFMGDILDLIDQVKGIKSALDIVSEFDVDFLRTLQSIHDDIEVDGWKDALTIMAAENGWSCEEFKDL